jgi:hypothetical protein
VAAGDSVNFAGVKMEILVPGLTLVALTLCVVFRMGILRLRAIRRGDIHPGFFSLYRGHEEPEKLAAYSRHVTNLYEAPVLFYVVCITAFVTEQDSSLLLALAWAYVGLRFVHSYVHLTSNIVLLRFRLFVASLLVLGGMWAMVLTHIMRQ